MLKKFLSVKIFSVKGIPIKIHFSWIIMCILLCWVLSVFYFPSENKGFGSITYWLQGVVTIILITISLLLHEMAHTFWAVKYKIPVTDITLFFLGGVAHMMKEPSTPQSEIKIASAGPLMSLCLALLFFVLSLPIKDNGFFAPIFSQMIDINLIFAFFNLIPGFPMDGGRIFRSILWLIKKNAIVATRWAIRVGKGIAFAFIFAGSLLILAKTISNGLWLVFLGWFLYNSANQSYEYAKFRYILSKIKVKDVMIQNMITVPEEATVYELVYNYFLKHGFTGLPVVNNGEIINIVTVEDVKNFPKETWKSITIKDLKLPLCSAEYKVSKDENLFKAMESMIAENKNRLLVVDNDQVVGLITKYTIEKHYNILTNLFLIEKPEN